MLTPACSYFLRGLARGRDSRVRRVSTEYGDVEFRPIVQTQVEGHTLEQLEVRINGSPKGVRFSWVEDCTLKQPLDRYNGRFRSCGGVEGRV